MPDSTLSTLTQIRTKVRRLTGSPSVNQLSNGELDNYVNNFVLYDFSECVRLQGLRTNLKFYTDPYIDTYTTNTTDVDDPLYNFKNKYITVHPPVYIAGKLAFYSQSQAEFFNSYSKNQSIQTIATGNGVITAYTGTLSSTPVLRNNVVFSSVNTANAGLRVSDDGAGALVGDVTTSGTIDYVTGAYSFTFTSAPASGTAIKSQTIPYTAGIPTAVLYYDNTFTVRPVPDAPYQIELEVYVRPTEILSTATSPELSQWWQYIAYGAAKKIFEDRMDMESVSLIMPEFKQQERLVLRRTLIQHSNERVATIYTNNTNLSSDGNDYNQF